MVMSSRADAQDEQRFVLEFYAAVGKAFADAGLTQELFDKVKDRPHQMASVVGYMKTLSSRPKGLRGSSS